MIHWRPCYISTTQSFFTQYPVLITEWSFAFFSAFNRTCDPRAVAVGVRVEEVERAEVGDSQTHRYGGCVGVYADADHILLPCSSPTDDLAHVFWRQEQCRGACDPMSLQTAYWDDHEPEVGREYRGVIFTEQSAADGHRHCRETGESYSGKISSYKSHLSQSAL